MTNRTNPDGSQDHFDSDDSGSPLHGVCQQSYPSANRDIYHTIGGGELAVTYRLFASAAMSSGEDGVAPFFASDFAVNYRKDRGWQRVWFSGIDGSHPSGRPAARAPLLFFHGTKLVLRRS